LAAAAAPTAAVAAEPAPKPVDLEPAAPSRPAPAVRDAAPSTYTPKHLAEKILTSRSAIEGERKLVTVMFTDVSGFTAMSERLDPEEVHAIMDRAFEVILGAVHEYEGTINQFLGDGVMALFGAPIAHEDHAGRALRTALAIQQRLEPLREDVQRAHGREFRMRIGINSGPVVVGAIGRDLRMDYTAVGDTVNLAARLMGISQPGQIVASPNTRALCEGYFVFDDLGKFELKGKTEPVHAYSVQRAIARRTRLEVSRERGLTPLVGRATERERLTEVFRNASGGGGGVVVLSGDPGVGKSRLLYEFLQGLDDTEHLELETTCASYGRSMAYRPILELYRQYLDLSEALVPDEIKRRVSDCLRALDLETREDERSWLFHHFLGIPVAAEFLMRIQGAMLRDRTNDLLCSVILRESERRPVIVVVENVHWIDASSEEFLRLLATRVPAHRVMLVLTTRAGGTLDWLPPMTQRIALEALDSENLRTMVRTLLGTPLVAEQLFHLLMEKGEGNPLYVEEIVRQLQETKGILVEDGEARLRAADVTVPGTIRDIIAARVDRLNESPKQTLQVASVIGRRFGVTLVSRIRDSDRNHVAGDLQDLHAVDFVFPSARDPELMYSFKHALTQDVVYTSLLERRRRLFHAAAGLGLEELYADRIGDFVELLAYHYEHSGEDEKAVDYAILAAEKAQRRWANSEALTLFDGALKRLRTMPDTPPNQLRRIDAVVKQAEVKFALGQHAEHIQALEGIRELVDAVADPRRRATWYYWTGFLHSLIGAKPEVPINYCLEAVRIAESSGLDELKAYAECCLSEAYLNTGRLHDALEASEPALATFEARGNTWWAARTLWGLSSIAIFLGEWERSLEYCRRALEHARAVGDVRMKIVASWRTGWSHIQRGDTESGLRWCEEALALSPGPFDAAMTRAAKGHGLVKAGDLSAGAMLLAESVEWFHRSRLRLTRSVFAIWLGDAYLRQGKLVEARSTLEDVLRTSREVGYRHLEGTAQRLLGETLSLDDPASAAEHLEAALGVLREVGAANEVAKTLVARARLKCAGGDAAEARQLLEKALSLFDRLGTVDGALRVRANLDALGGKGRRLAIVSRSHRGLYNELLRDLAGDQDIEVSLDRRGDDEYPTDAHTGPDGGAHRRTRSDVDATIRSVGYAIVTRELAI
jgi:class 3 adenylate cyclase/tetratricopeptide (TPR) repeat protein